MIWWSIVSRYGRESVVVTKLFLVEYVPPSDALSTDDKEEHVLKDHELGIKQVYLPNTSVESSPFNLS